MHDGPNDGSDVTPAGTGTLRMEQDARGRLQALDDAPLEQHVEVYEDVHRRLQEGLADLDES